MNGHDSTFNVQMIRGTPWKYIYDIFATEKNHNYELLGIDFSKDGKF